VGLSVFGGTDTLGPGGFSGTPLETALPVDMQVRNPQQKPPVAVVLVLESVESSAGDAVVRGAAKALVEKLSARDYVGVTDSITGLAVPLQQVGTRTKVENAILNIPNFGDPQSYDPYIADAEHALLAHPGQSSADANTRLLPASMKTGMDPARRPESVARLLMSADHATTPAARPRSTARSCEPRPSLRPGRRPRLRPPRRRLQAPRAA